MQITIDRLNDAYHFRATNEMGNVVEMDSSADHGGHDKGFRPMQMLLAGLGGCSGIDVIDILKKQRQEVKDLKIKVEGERKPGAVPALFEKIHIHFDFVGEIDESKAEKAVALSMEKYCSVAKTLEKTAQITTTFSVKK